ncbi:hypothetical protein [Arcobacter sp.]|uniref:hypothetical protein n=1 Tax=unclassified Arcobacter TaxID=2593671 RepID=UPI003B00C1C0
MLFLCVTASADRCNSYVQEVRRAHYKVFGLDYPYWYAVGQLRQESNCRDVISRDGVGSQGVAQITYRWWQGFLSKKGIDNISSIKNQLLAQAYIMKDAKKQAYSSHLWVAYQVYNGGSLVNKEITRARNELGIREIPHDIAKKYCKRKTITFNNGQKINACDINYEYSEKVYKYGQKYKLFSDGKYIFW